MKRSLVKAMYSHRQGFQDSAWAFWMHGHVSWQTLTLNPRSLGFKASGLGFRV